MKKKYAWIAVVVVLLLILVDQVIKFWVKTHLTVGQTVPLLGQWFNLHFVENEGMAFGISFGQQIGKFVLSLVRIVLVGLLCWYFAVFVKRGKMDGVVLTIFCLVIAGAIGNIIDSMFYGIFFTESNFLQVAEWSPGHGYAPFFFGKVVDMFYLKLFPIPEKFPLWGGSWFFPAIFNFADACITVGIFLAIIFNKRIFSDLEKKSEENVATEAEDASVVSE
ncbi:MAG: lipoprotein signal peptidase [Bacteroidales bacterium]|nr:lipoprotein signal peptidase [Bacteroidales bacterium]